jgi:hypothetical protein
LTWTAPEIDYGEAILGYTIYWGTDSESLEPLWFPIDTDWVSTDHKLDTVYYFQLSARNEMGEGNLTVMDSVFTLEAPTQARNLEAEAGDYWIVLDWDGPIYDGGNSSLSYEVVRWSNVDARQIIINVTEELISWDGDVEGGLTYYYSIIARNPLHKGPRSEVESLEFFSRPRSPTDVTVTVEGDTLVVSWRAPADTGGLPIKKYRIERTEQGSGNSASYTIGNETSYIDGDIDSEGTFIYTVWALNLLGEGQPSLEKYFPVTAVVTEPRDLVIINKTGFLRLRWEPPERVEFAQTIGYRVFRGETASNLTMLDVLTNATKYDDLNITFNKYYYYQVRLETDVGLSAPSDIAIGIHKKPDDQNGNNLWIIILTIILALLIALGVVYSLERRGTPEIEEEKPTPPLPKEKEGPIPPWDKSLVKESPAVGPIAHEVPEGILPYIVEEVFVVYNDGRLITSCAREECCTADADLMSGMLIAIQGLIQDGLESGGKLESIKYGENLISLATGDHIVLAAVVYGKPDEQLQEDLRKTVSNIEGTYAGIIEDWTGEPSAMAGLDDLVMPLIDKTAYLTRDNVGDVLADHGVALLSAVDFHRGYVRLKMAAVNATYDTIIDAAVEVHYDGDMLRMELVEPDTIVNRGDRVTLGNILPGERKTVALLFDPQICQSTHVDGHLSYYSTKGELRYVEMKRRTADVVCPIFFTKENANTAMLRKLMAETLHQNDLRIYRYPKTLEPKEVLAIAKQALGSDEIQLVREYITEKRTFEAEVWYYAETKVKGYQFVIRLGVVEDKGVVELFAASTAMEPITGLLADFRQELNRILEERYAEDVRMEVAKDDQLRRYLERRPLHLETDEG